MRTTDQPIIVEQTFKHDRKIIWSAITEHSKMQKWFFSTIENFEPKVGFKTSFAVNTPERTFTHLWEITEVVPFKKITYSWRYAEYEGDSLVTFELFKLDNKSMLRLNTKVLIDFPGDIPEFKRESGLLGWRYFINDSLVNFLK